MSHEVRVEVGKIREFARATKSTNPAYLAGDAPVMPVTFLVTNAFWSPPNEELWVGDQARMLHGEQEFVFHGEPPRAGAVLTAETRVDREYEKEGKRGGVMKFTEIVTEFRDPSGTLVAESRTTGILPAGAVAPA